MITNQWAKEIAGDMVSVYLGTDDAFARKMKYRKMDVEEGWDGNWYKAGCVPAEPEEHKKKVKIDELQHKLNEVDQKSIRSIRAIQAGTCTEDDEAKLSELEGQAAYLRRQIKELGE